MERPINTPESDITQEPYKGPGALVTGAGEGAIAHYGTGLVGLIGGGLIGGLIPKQVNHIEKSFKNFHSSTRDSNIIMRALGTMANWTHLAAHKSVSHLPGRERIFKHIPANRLEAVVFSGGLLGFIGFFIAPMLFMFTGAKHSNDGKQQFERAKDEILTTRAERDALREKFVEAETELTELRAKHPKRHDNHTVTDEPNHGNAHGGSTAALSAIEHTDSPVSISKPKIEGPPIQTPTIQGPGPESPLPKNQWWDGKEQGASHAERLAARDAEVAMHQEAAR